MSAQVDPPARVPERPRAREDVVFRGLAREWVIYDPESRLLHVLNLTAALVWSLCDGRHGLPDMVRAISESLEGVPDEETVCHDVREALACFRSEGLLA